MPQYDPDPEILRSRCYVEAQMYCATWFGSSPEDFEELPADQLTVAREETREFLLHQFPDIEGPEIAELMDEGLADIGFPFDRLPS